MRLFLSILLCTFCVNLSAQDTFSIVAVDPVTGEVGSAGASCVDLYTTSLSDDGFLGQLFPNLGAINTQAWYIPANQNNAADRMFEGDTPSEIIAWLAENDAQDTPELRQYGIVAFVDGQVESAGYTGSSTDDYKNHVEGPTYCIQGNILLGQEVLDSMESKFNNAEGDLACKLMAAMQGANMIGADTRCTDNGTSSLFAFLKVAQPNDVIGSPSFEVSLRTHDGDGIEPIDSLQILFDQVHSCGPSSIESFEKDEKLFAAYPNPFIETLHLENHGSMSLVTRFEVYTNYGMLLQKGEFTEELNLTTSEWAPGVYQVTLYSGDRRNTFRLVKS